MKRSRQRLVNGKHGTHVSNNNLPHSTVGFGFEMAIEIMCGSHNMSTYVVTTPDILTDDSTTVTPRAIFMLISLSHVASPCYLPVVTPASVPLVAGL